MEQSVPIESPANRLVVANNTVASQIPFANNSIMKVTPQVGGAGCGCSTGAEGGGGDTATLPTYVYAIGKIEMRFPSLGLEN